MLASAGIDFESIPADIDEAALRDRTIAAEGRIDAERIALGLARAKAEQVSARHPDALVVGSDQVLDCAGRLHEKPADLAAARETLLALRGRTHTLVSAVALAAGGSVVWTSVDRASMTMRGFTPAFLDAYLSRAGEVVLGSVGAYQLEGLGVQLFERIEGSHFTILGMPLVPLLAVLRERGIAAA